MGRLVTEERQLPLDVEKIEWAPLGREKVAVRVSGRWRGRRWSPDTRAFLVVESNGRRHRFPAISISRRQRMGRASRCEVSFALPASLEPQLREQLSLWIGNVEIRLPRESPVDDEPPAGDEQDGVGIITMAETEEPRHETDALVAALRAELRERASEEARLRAQLAKAQGELKRNADIQGELESVHQELEDEFDGLRRLIEEERASRDEIEARAVVLTAEVAELRERLAELTPLPDQLAELRSQLAQIDVAREAATGEADGLRSELDRLGTELAVARGTDRPVAPELARAQELLAEARAVRARLRERAEARQQRVND